MTEHLESEVRFVYDIAFEVETKTIEPRLEASEQAIDLIELQALQKNLLIMANTLLTHQLNLRYRGLVNHLFRSATIETSWNSATELGLHSDPGYIKYYLDDNTFLELRFTSLEITSGSKNGRAKAILLYSIASFPAWEFALDQIDEFNVTANFRDNLEYSDCGTQVNITYSESDYVSALLNNLPTIKIPENYYKADQAARSTPSIEVCIIQSLLSRVAPEGADRIAIDGLFGRKTYDAFEQFKHSIGSASNDHRVLTELISTARSRRDLVHIAWDATKQIALQKYRMTK